jgi:diphthamide synthase (EF-2-diphthine--ammonia ligase)
MHAVRRTLLEAQAAALGLPLHVVELPSPCPNQVYEDRMQAAVDAARAAGVTRMVFGDLYLADVREYRERMLAGSGIEPVFPLWLEPTDQLARRMTGSGLKAVLTCVDPAQAPATLVGRWYDDELLDALPPDVDPCGENGEFHTFVVDGPGFGQPLDVVVGDVVERDGFVFADVLPAPRVSADR